MGATVTPTRLLPGWHETTEQHGNERTPWGRLHLSVTRTRWGNYVGALDPWQVCVQAINGRGECIAAACEDVSGYRPTVLATLRKLKQQVTAQALRALDAEVRRDA